MSLVWTPGQEQAPSGQRRTRGGRPSRGSREPRAEEILTSADTGSSSWTSCPRAALPVGSPRHVLRADGHVGGGLGEVEFPPRVSEPGTPRAWCRGDLVPPQHSAVPWAFHARRTFCGDWQHPVSPGLGLPGLWLRAPTWLLLMLTTQCWGRRVQEGRPLRRSSPCWQQSFGGQYWNSVMTQRGRWSSIKQWPQNGVPLAEVEALSENCKKCAFSGPTQAP